MLITPVAVVRTAVFAFASIVLVSRVSAQQLDSDRRGATASVSATVFGGYDTDVTAGVAPADEQPSAPSIGGVLRLNYQQRSDKIGFGTRLSADTRSYRSKDPINATAFTGSANFGAELTSRLRFDAYMASAYSPHFTFSVLPDPLDNPLEAEGPSLDEGVAMQDSVSSTGGGTLTWRMTNRSSLNLRYGGSYYKFLGDNYAMTSRNYGGGYSYNMTRYSTLKLGYTETEVQYPAFRGSPARVYRQRSIDAGVNYSRPLSVSRRTTISFGTGTAAIDTGIDTFYTATGNAAIHHQIRRTWTANAVYTRGIGVVGGFGEPFFADAVSGDVRGQLTRNIRMITRAGYSNGSVGAGPRAGDYSGFVATTRMEIAVSRRAGIFGSYFYYGYTLDEAVRLVFDYPRQIGRHGVRAGMIFRFPLTRERMN